MDRTRATLTHDTETGRTTVRVIGPGQARLTDGPEPDGWSGVSAAAVLFAFTGYDVTIRRAR